MIDNYFENEKHSSPFWVKERPPSSVSAVHRYRHWLICGLTTAGILALIIALGASTIKTSNRLWSVEQTVSTLTDIIQSLNTSLQNAQKMAEELKQVTPGDSCPESWEQFQSSCFFFSKDTLSWNDSRDWCSKQGAHLAILQTDAEWDFVTYRTIPRYTWIGLTDERTGQWEWVDQRPYVMEQRRWMPGQPDNWSHHRLGTEDCAHLHQDGRLNDLHCTQAMRYVCQRYI